MVLAAANSYPLSPNAMVVSGEGPKGQTTMTLLSLSTGYQPADYDEHAEKISKARAQVLADLAAGLQAVERAAAGVTELRSSALQDAELGGGEAAVEFRAGGGSFGVVRAQRKRDAHTAVRTNDSHYGLVPGLLHTLSAANRR